MQAKSRFTIQYLVLVWTTEPQILRLRHKVNLYQLVIWGSILNKLIRIGGHQ